MAEILMPGDFTGEGFGQRKKHKRNPRYTGEAQQSEQLQTFLDRVSPFRNDQTTPASVHLTMTPCIGYVYDRKGDPHQVALACQHAAIKDEDKEWICRHECSAFLEAKRIVDSALDQVS